MTPRLSRERMPGLHGQAPRFFANWLRSGVPAFLAGAGRDAFPGAANYVGWAGAIEEDIAAIFGVLNSAEQSAFQEGVAIALAELPLRDAGSGAALIAMIRLAGLVNAREAVDVIIPVLVDADAARVDQVVNAYCRAFDLVVELASPAPHAVRALLTMLTSDGFRDELAAPALVALARADPTNFAAHLDALARPLNAQYHPDRLDEPGRRSTTDRDRLLETVARLVPVAAVTPAFGTARRAAFSSDWIVRDWFSRGVSTSDAPRVAALWNDVQEWIYISGARDEEKNNRKPPSECAAGQPDEFEAALGRLPVMAGDDDWY